MARDIRIGTAGWSIPRVLADRFPTEGSTLERYAAVFDAVEVNSSFYRPHRRTTWERWAAATPPGFHFSAKLPRAITHERRLIDCAELIDRFLAETAGLGDRRGPLVVQTPGTLAFDTAVFAAFVALWRDRFDGLTAWEPRHPSWFTAEADAALAAARIARIAADPPPTKVDADSAGRPGGWPGLVYRRLHGSPRIYASAYDNGFLESLASETVAHKNDAWIVFDNTMLGASAGNALCFKEKTSA